MGSFQNPRGLSAQSESSAASARPAASEPELARIAERKSLHIALPPPPQKTPLPAIAHVLNREKAQEFLGNELPWGETGRQFITRLRRCADDQPTTTILQECERIGEKNGRTVTVREVQHSLGLASQIGLLVSGESRGYHGGGMAIDIPVKVYRVSGNPEIEPLLVDTSTNGLHSGDIQKIQQVLTQAPFFVGPLPFRSDLTALEFFQFLTEPRTLKEIVSHPEFFPNHKPEFSPKLRDFIEGQLIEACAVGLVRGAKSSGDVIRYVVNAEARSLL